MTCAGILYLVVIVPLALGASYLLALAGEPQSVWLWCRVLRACA
jgi:hypothetical protein